MDPQKVLICLPFPEYEVQEKLLFFDNFESYSVIILLDCLYYDHTQYKCLYEIYLIHQLQRYLLQL